MQTELNGTQVAGEGSMGTKTQDGLSSEQLVMVPREQVWDWIPHIKSLFQDAVERGRGEYTCEDLAAGLLKGELQLVVGRLEESIFAHALISFEKFPEFIALNVYAASGRGLASIVRLMPQIKYHALANGATQVRVFGRKGWQRALAAQGFKEAAVLLTWDSGNGR